MKNIIYLRKSRAEENQSVEEVLKRHETTLQEYAIAHYGEIIPEQDIYREVASGESVADRPKMQEVLLRIESKDVDGVLCMDISRLSRGDMDECGSVLKSFALTNTLIVTPTKIYNLSDENDYRMTKMELIFASEYLTYQKMILSRGRQRSSDS